MSLKILYLYTEVMGYTIATINALVRYGAEVHIIHWDEKKLTPYQVPSISGAHFYARSMYNKKAILDLAFQVKPQITVVSGWIDHTYLSVAKILRAKGLITVVGLDGQRQDTFRQWLAAVLGQFGYFTQYFSHAWVAGTYQYEYARYLGFKKKQIVFDLYSADLEKFLKYSFYSKERKRGNYPHRFLYVGRYESVKGIDILMTAWSSLEGEHGDWELHLVGNGSLKDVLLQIPNVVVKDFMQPDDLVEEISKAGCFILPSRVEPWGVVVHEVAGAGLPCIASDAVGSATAFVINGLNGYVCSPMNSEQLANAIRMLMKKSDVELLDMGRASIELAQRITPHTSAANLLSILY